MANKYKNQYHELIANLHITDGYIFNHFDQKLAPFQLSVQQYSVLRQLQEVYPNTLNAGELKSKMHESNPDMTRLTDRLIKKNLIVRETDPENRRKVMLRLTEESNEFVKQVGLEFQNFESIVNHLTDEEVQTLNTLLIKIRNR